MATPRHPVADRRRPSATMADVAALAGVSIATVSRVLNGSKHVAEPSASAVRDAARRLSFHPSRPAQLLARRRTRVIGLVISDLLNETLLTWARAAAEEAEALGYRIILCDGRTSPDAEARQLEQLLEARVDAICLVGPVAIPHELRDEILAAGISLTPAFMHDAQTSSGVRAAAERPAIDAAVDLLVGTGSRWILTVAAPLDEFADRVFDARRAAIAERARHHGLVVAPHHHLGPDPATLQRQLRRHRTPGAIVVLNHDLPGSVVATVLASGRTIPHDVSLIAFGDSRAARSWLPRTTVITRDMELEGRQHIAALVERLAAPPDGPTGAGIPHTMQPATLVERETTASAGTRRRPSRAG